MPAHDAEVIIVGAGPAGSTAASLLADEGHSVLLLDKASFPRHKPCSDYISAGGEPMLDQLGVLGDIQRAGASRMEAMLVHAPDGSRFRADFGQVEAGSGAIGLSRIRLDQILLERARDAGANVLERTHVRGLLTDGGHVVGVQATRDGTRTELRAPLVIGADGHHSVIARELQLDIPWRWPRKTGLAAHYRNVEGLGPAGEMHVGHGAYAGLAILEHGLVNLTVVVPTDDLKQRSSPLETTFEELVASLPGIAGKMQGAEREGSIRGVGPMGRRARQVAGNGWLLLGDAASFLDPFVGEGVSNALQSGFLAAPVASAALRSGDVSAAGLDPYRQARRRELTARRAVSWIVQGFVNTPVLMNYVTQRLDERAETGHTLSGVLGNLQPATRALSPMFLARLLRP